MNNKPAISHDIFIKTTMWRVMRTGYF